jgi:hypothetical protein
MHMAMTVTKTELARRTRQIVDWARRGQAVWVESYGEEQVVVVDAIDYRLLTAAASRSGVAEGQIAAAEEHRGAPAGLSDDAVRRAVAHEGGDVQAAWNLVVGSYFLGDISLGRAAELLGLSRWDLHDRMNRLHLPLLLGSTTIDEADEEYRALG